MLRSIIIGFAVAALLQVGMHTAASTSGMPLAKTIDRVSLECESAALGQLISQGYRTVVR